MSLIHISDHTRLRRISYSVIRMINSLGGAGGGFRGGDDMYLPLRLYCLFHEGSLPNLFYGYLKVTVTALSAVMVIYLIA